MAVTNKRLVDAIDAAIAIAKEDRDTNTASILNAIVATMYIGKPYMDAFNQMVIDFSANMIVIVQDIKKNGQS